MVAVSWRQASARRLDRHGLTSPLASLGAAARAMCGTHAQIMSAAEISLGLRVAGTDRGDVATAIWAERELVKTYGPRGTVHLLAAADLARWSAAMAAVPRTTSQAAHVRLDAAQQAEVVAAIDDALDDTDHTVEELDDAVRARCEAWASERTMPAFGGYWPRWRQVLSSPAAATVVCFGSNQGRRTTYASARRWRHEPLPAPEVALRALAHDYLHAYGPARPEHFAQWLAAPTPWARELFAGAEEVELDGTPAWVNPGDTVFDRPARGLHLLPYFDAFVVGSHPRAALFPARAAERALAGTQAGNFPALVIDGVVAGVWHLKRSGKRITVTVEPLRVLTKAQSRLLDNAVDRVGAIADARVELTIGTVAVGPHA